MIPPTFHGRSRAGMPRSILPLLWRRRVKIPRPVSAVHQLAFGVIAGKAPVLGQLVVTVAVVEDVEPWKARIFVVALTAETSPVAVGDAGQ
jgi:hypothetical protein